MNHDDAEMAPDFISQVMVGHTVPDFEIDVYTEDDFSTVKLSDYHKKWLVLFFYPADFTFVCPTELEEMAALYEEFKKEGAEVISVSTDTKWSHKAWHDTSEAVGKITFPMAADPTGNLSRAFGVYIEESGVTLRGSFVIDPKGVLQAMEVHADGIGRNAKELLRKLRAAKFVHENGNQVCPASWEPGAETLEPGVKLVGKI